MPNAGTESLYIPDGSIAPSPLALLRLTRFKKPIVNIEWTGMKVEIESAPMTTGRSLSVERKRERLRRLFGACWTTDEGFSSSPMHGMGVCTRGMTSGARRTAFHVANGARRVKVDCVSKSVS